MRYKINNQKLKADLEKFLKHQGTQHIGTALVALLVIGSVSILGTELKKGSEAASVGTMYVTPSDGTFTPGSDFSVTVREESGTDLVNSVQASLRYDANLLQVTGVTEGTDFSFETGTDTATAGIIRLGRGMEMGHPGISGDRVVAVINFKVLNTTGTAALSFDKNESFIIRTSDQQDVLNTIVGGSFAIRQPAPTANSITPTSGRLAGGTPVTVTGKNFQQGATVKFGDVAATSVTYVSSTNLTAITPASSSAGAVAVVVTNPDGQNSTVGTAYTYVAPVPAPTVSTVSPSTGPIGGGTVLTIAGTNFVNGAKVKVGSSDAANVTFVSSTSIRATTPLHTATGSKNITVTNPDGQSATKSNAFTYVLPAPVISSLSRTSGFTGGGLPVTITGSNFMSGAIVTFGGVEATQVRIVNAATITLNAPESASNSAVAVVVRNPDGQSATKTNAFTYKKPGDSNGDGRVNGIDYSIMAAHDGQNYSDADYNQDGTVGAPDLAILLSRWTW